jgi:hypothetical protein
MRGNADNMSDRNEKTPEQVSDEDYKVAPTSADNELVSKASKLRKAHIRENF